MYIIKKKRRKNWNGFIRAAVERELNKLNITGTKFFFLHYHLSFREKYSINFNYIYILKKIHNVKKFENLNM